MKKKVIISIQGVQKTDNEPDVVEFVTDGRLYDKEGSYYISYKESEITGMEGTTTTLKVDDGRVTLMRHGTIHSHLVFEKGQRHLSCYDTGMGQLTVGINAFDLSAAINDKGGKIDVGYTVEVDQLMTGINEFHITVREAGIHAPAKQETLTESEPK